MLYNILRGRSMYTPLKVTTEYTLLKSLIKVSDLISFLIANNIKSCAICDENLYGCLDFYNACIANHIKPIIGLSVKINDFDIYLYALNYSGYKNLLKIHTLKEKNKLNLSDLELYSSELLAIIPYKSVELWSKLSFYNYLYIGYASLYEKNNAQILTNNIVYVNDLRALKLTDIKYLNFLDDLRQEARKDYSNNYYQNLEFIDEDKIQEIVSLIDLNFPQNQRYIPEYKTNVDTFEFLKRLALAGLNKRLTGNVSERYLNRLNHELNIIKSMGFVNYFLIVYDYVLYAKKNNILVGPGRGSAAGSLVSFSIGITDIDPLRYNLLFERFLNPARVTMPDIDIDFDASKREDVINYVRNKYGYDKVALGLTFNTLKSKLVLREVGKILKIDATLLDKFVHLIDGNKSLKENYYNATIRKYLNNYQELKNLYEISFHLEGLKKNTSIHAAGVVISSVSLDEVIPIHISNNELITGIAMEYLENIGLLKMDFLGLKNLTIIANILNMLGKNVLKDINLNDSLVYELFKSAKTDGVFQFETPAMKSLLTKLRPCSFADLIAGVALGRPGPKDHAESFIKRKNGEEKVTYIHPDLESILKDTYGILLYQEQIIAILVKIAGYSNQEADLVRRAISKKKEDVLNSEKEKFIKKAIANGYKENIGKEIYDLIVKFANYGFNKSHSVSYALIAYQMAYLKTYYPAYFFIELLNESKNNPKNSSYFLYLKSKNIKFFKPSINNPYSNYYIKDNKLYMPLWIIKNITEDITQKIIMARGNGYTDIFDFALKTKDFMTPSLIETLIRAGAMDCFSLNHQTLINNISSAINYGALADEDGLISKPLIVEYKEFSQDILRQDELNSYGFYITNHPASIYLPPEYTKLNTIKNYAYKKIKTVVIVDKISNIKTKNNDDMAFFTGSDETGNADFTVFPKVYSLFKGIKLNELVLIQGEVQKRFDKYQIIVNNIKRMGGLNE